MTATTIHIHSVKAGFVDHEVLRFVGADLVDCPGRCCRGETENPSCCGLSFDEVMTEALTSEDSNVRGCAEAHFRTKAAT